MPVTQYCPGGLSGGDSDEQAIARRKVLQVSEGADMIPDAVARYRIFAEIAAGGFGTVYRAVDPTLGREVAVKVLHPHLARDPVLRERFVGEGRALAAIRHPNLVQVYDAGEANGLVYLAMEYIPGRSLAAHAHGRRLDLGELLPILDQVAGALEAVHAARKVHRDVKPENILLADDGRAVLLDLGIARSLDEPGLSSTSMVLGTPGYLAPEQLEGPELTGPHTDIYQLGATVYALLTGAPPFVGTTAQVLAAISRDDPPDLEELRPVLPPHAVAAVRWAMAKRPADRPASTGAFATALAGNPLPLPAQSLQPRRDPARATDTATKPRAAGPLNGKRRRPSVSCVAAAAVAALALVLLGAGAVALDRRGGGASEANSELANGGPTEPPFGAGITTIGGAGQQGTSVQTAAQSVTSSQTPATSLIGQQTTTCAAGTQFSVAVEDGHWTSSAGGSTPTGNAMRVVTIVAMTNLGSRPAEITLGIARAPNLLVRDERGREFPLLRDGWLVGRIAAEYEAKSFWENYPQGTKYLPGVAVRTVLAFDVAENVQTLTLVGSC
jgi:serine/threonine-protein kinase